MASDRVSSILAADFGSVQTRVVLFDVVDGEYRVVAHGQGRTTIGYPDDDLNVGLKRILDSITSISGRQFYNETGHIITPENRNRSGVDYFVTTVSAGRPLRVITVGLVPQVSVSSALRAISGTYVERVAEFHLRDGYSEEDRLNAMITGRPDLVFVAGGTNNGAASALQDILDIVELGLKIQDPELRPPLLYAGNDALKSAITERFSELTDVLISDNIRPAMGVEAFDAAQVALAKAYDDHRDAQGKAFVSLGEMSSTGLLPSAQSYGLVAKYYADTRKGNVVIMDIGSTSSILTTTFDGVTQEQISTTKGLGQSAVTLIDDVGEQAIEDWLPFYPNTSEIHNYALNKVSRPGSIPMDLRGMFIEQAMMRAAIRQMVETGRKTWKGVNPSGYLPPIDLIVIAGGALNGQGHAVYDMMMAADCIQPVGITEIKADRIGMLSSMRAIARIQPEATVQILDGKGLEHLGTLVSFEGPASRDGVAANLVITTDDESYKYPLKAGEVLSLSPVPEDYTLTIKVRCQRGWTLNGKKRMTLKLTGGTGGILLDARGRELRPPATVEERMRVLPSWIASVTDDELMTLPDAWSIDQRVPLTPEKRATLEAMAVAAPATAAAPRASEEDIFADVGDGEPEFDDIFAELDDDKPDNDDDELGSLRDLLD